MWATGPGLDRLPAAGLVASHQSVDPTPRHLVSACGFGLAQVLLYDRQDDDPFLRHGSSSKPSRYERCLDSPMNDVLNQDTLSSTHNCPWSDTKRISVISALCSVLIESGGADWGLARLVVRLEEVIHHLRAAS